jgi:hypothetical protein
MTVLATAAQAVVVLAKVVDVSALSKVVLASFVGAIGVTMATSLAVLGAIRFADMRRDERTLEAGAFAVLAVVGAVASIAALVFGIFIMTSK